MRHPTLLALFALGFFGVNACGGAGGTEAGTQTGAASRGARQEEVICGAIRYGNEAIPCVAGLQCVIEEIRDIECDHDCPRGMHCVEQGQKGTCVANDGSLLGLCREKRGDEPGLCGFFGTAELSCA